MAKKFIDAIRAVADKVREADKIYKDLIDQLMPYSEYISYQEEGNCCTLQFTSPVHDVMKIVNIVCGYPGAVVHDVGRRELEFALEQSSNSAYNETYHSAYINMRLRRSEVYHPPIVPARSNVSTKIKVKLDYVRHPGGCTESRHYQFHSFIRVFHDV